MTTKLTPFIDETVYSKNTLTDKVHLRKPAIIPDPVSKPNSHANADGSFDVRQGKDTPLPDVIIEAGIGDAKVEIANPGGTSAKFKDTTHPDATHQTVTAANGKPVPDINGGDKTGDASVTVIAASKAVVMHILPLADNVVSTHPNAGANPAQVLQAINDQMGLCVTGHASLANNTLQNVVPAPKTMVRMTLVTDPVNALHFVDNGQILNPTDSVVRLSDGKGLVMFKPARIQVAYEGAHTTFVPKKSSIRVEYDISGLMDIDEVKAQWSTAVSVPLPTR